MRRSILLVLVSLPVGVLTTETLAATWCSINHPTAVFCDDFDRYCIPAPPAPQECSPTADMDIKKFLNTWRFGYDVAVPCSMMLPDTDGYISAPYSAKSTNQADGSLTRAMLNLEPYCQAAFGSTYKAIIGTDLNPIVLEFVINGQTANKIRYANNYMELALGGNQASTDYRLTANCSTLCSGGANTQYPIICQQQGAPADCPPLSSAPHRSAIAVGALAYLDTNPCHCNDLSIPSPYNLRLSFFDGYQWWKLQQGLFPGSGDFLLRNNFNHVRLTIKTSTVKVELTCTDPNPDEYSWCIVPRDYIGRFNRLYAGFKAPCRLKTTAWECQTTPDCTTIKGAPNGGVPRYDNVALYGGQAYTGPGACCFGDTSCVETYAADCPLMGGVFQGSGTECAAAVCCADFLPDRDRDSDVDLKDFGWFQACVTGSNVAPDDPRCKCADMNRDGDVDISDLTSFIGCLSGMNVPANPSCAP
ncbi:MAG TPA: hypothetical protein VLM89_02215 [Phycisphaerae bacterium]|nr:hypothetical protein [Phycisphaerae bacterium]